jgi:MiaB/RimO family radical SAM methylthiotransferase
LDANLPSKKFHLACIGCPEGRIDSSRVQKFLLKNGWKRTNKLEEADLIIFRGCGLTKGIIQNCLRLIKDINTKKKADAQFIVWGCLPKIDLESLRTVYRGVTFGEEEVDVLDKILDAKKPLAEVVANSVIPIYEFQRSGISGLVGKITSYISNKLSIVQSPSIFQIKVSTGCLDNCSFCSVHKSRGLLRSKSIEQVVNEFRDGLSKGYRYFGLLGTDVGAYGKDIGHNLVDLLTELTKEKGKYKIGLRNINPHHLIEMFEQIRPIFASGKVWFLHSSAESGSNRILKLMRRRYNIQDFIRCFRSLNKDYPNIFLRTQIMVGFPTETDEDFQKSKRLIDEVRFDSVEVYCFSPVPGIDASAMEGQVPNDIKGFRGYQLSSKSRFQHPYRKLRQMFCLYH